MQIEMTINSNSFAVLYKSHIKAVHALVQSFRFYDAAADDLVQEIFVKAWTKRDSLRDNFAFSGWLMQIAKNCCLREIRKQKNLMSVLGIDCSTDSEGGSPSEMVLTANDDGESLELEFSLALIRQAILNHNHVLRAKVAYLFYIDEKHVEDIAEMLGMNRNTVGSHLRRFRLVVAQAVTSLVENNDLDLESSRRKLLRYAS